MSAWMIIPLLVCCLFIGLVISAIAFPESRCGSEYDGSRSITVLLWPLYLFTRSLFSLFDTIANGSKIISVLITKYLTK